MKKTPAARFGLQISVYIKPGEPLSPLWFWTISIATGLTAVFASYDLVTGRYSSAALGYLLVAALLYLRGTGVALEVKKQ